MMFRREKTYIWLQTKKPWLSSFHYKCPGTNSLTRKCPDKTVGSEAKQVKSQHTWVLMIQSVLSELGELIWKWCAGWMSLLKSTYDTIYCGIHSIWTVLVIFVTHWVVYFEYILKMVEFILTKKKSKINKYLSGIIYNHNQVLGG